MLRLNLSATHTQTHTPKQQQQHRALLTVLLSLLGGGGDASSEILKYFKKRTLEVVTGEKEEMKCS